MKNKNYTSPPPPVDLKPPKMPDGYDPKGHVALPKLELEPVSTSRKGSRKPAATPPPPPPPPQIKPGEMPRRNKRNTKPQNRKKRPTMWARLSGIDINIPKKILTYATLAIISVAIIVLGVNVIRGMVVNNAFEVFFDGESVGYIPINDTLTSEDFHRYAVVNLQNALGGTRIRVDQTVTIQEARTQNANRLQQSEMLALLQPMFDYDIAAIAVYVNDVFEVVLQRPQDLAHLESLLQERYFTEHTARAEFTENWEIRTMYVHPEEVDFWTADNAFYRLSRPVPHMYRYIVQDGDMLGTIAARFGTDFREIMRDNSLTSHLIIPGEPLYINTTRPLLTVRTFDEIYTVEPIEMPLEQREDPSMPYPFSTVLQQGMPGQQRGVLQIVRENGREVSRTVLDPEVIIAPVPHVVVVGTQGN